MRIVIFALVLSGCIRPAEERALLDSQVGIAQAEGIALTISGAHIRTLTADAATLWVQAPSLEVSGTTDSSRTLAITLKNAMPGGVWTGDQVVVLDEQLSATSSRWLIEVSGTEINLRYGPPDAGILESYRFAVMGDIQTALGSVDEVFRAINEHPGVRFVLSTGDLVQDGSEREFDELEAAYSVLNVPYYSTIGNHELAEDNPGPWHQRFGRHTVHFEFKNVHFSMVDTGNATIDPRVYSWLEEWLAQASSRVHVYAQHFPAIDPDGIRNTGMNSRSEAAKLLSMLAAGNVDTTFYGHIHTYRAFENAGIPAYVSGGGGATPERLDGIGRHFLSVDVDPLEGIRQVGVVRVDP